MPDPVKGKAVPEWSRQHLTVAWSPILAIKDVLLVIYPSESIHNRKVNTPKISVEAIRITIPTAFV
jgi:hypothetical protein